MVIYAPGIRSSADTESASNLILELASNTVRNRSLLSKQSVDDIFVRAPLMALLVTNLPADLWVRKKGEGRNIEKGREREERNIEEKYSSPGERIVAIYSSAFLPGEFQGTE